jgi:biopolymer transport protein ExbD
MQLLEKQSSKIHINITSLIDVLFLLLIFFMVSSTFVEKPGMKLDLPQAETAQITQMKEMVVSITPDNTLTLDGKEIAIGDLKSLLETRLKEDADAALILRADQTVTHGMVVEVMDIAKQSGVEKLVIATKEQ